MEDNATTAAAAAPMTFFERLIGIYFEPAKTFADISRKRSWLLMFLLLCIVTIGVNYTLMWRMDPVDAARKGLAMSEPFLKKVMNADQLALAREQAEKQALQPRTVWAKYAPIVTVPLGVLIAYVVLAAIFLLAYMLTGAGISYAQSFTTTIWGTGPPSIVVTLLSLIFIFVKNPLDLEISPVYNVVSNLGPLVDAKAHPALNSLLSSVDLFSIWTVVLLSIGFAAMSGKKLTAGQAAVPIVILWVLWILLKVGFWALVG
jgi:hypothetical protein